MANLSEQDREDLVAYLDGELDEVSARNLETRLNLDPAARAEADALQQTWGLLDYLPKPEPSASFTHRTLERLAVQTASIRLPGWSRWLIGVGWAAALLLAVLAGMGLARWIWPQQPAATAPGEDPEFVRELDHPDLFGDEGAHEDAAARLPIVQARYAEWLDQLEPADQARVKDAPDRDARLVVVKELREHEWLQRQPARHRNQVAGLRGKERTKRIEELRKEERQRKQQWVIVRRFAEQPNELQPTRLADLQKVHDELIPFVDEYLKPRLSAEELARLEKAEGDWPLFPQTLVELADAHPMALSDAYPGPKTFKELPKKIQNSINRTRGKKGGDIPKSKFDPKRVFTFKELQGAEGGWPRYPMEVVRYANWHGLHKKDAWPYELWAYHYDCLSPEMQKFVTDLKPLLTNAERAALASAETKLWPDYPRTINELARAHHLEPPWQTLPGPREYWDKYRVKKTSPR